jgi:hypothetical protein
MPYPGAHEGSISHLLSWVLKLNFFQISGECRGLNFYEVVSCFLAKFSHVE